MKKVVLGILVVALLIAGGAWFVTRPHTMPPPLDLPDTSAIPAEAQKATVNYVYDGDTLFLTTPADSNLYVRLLAVDAPEVGDNAECYGDAATAYLRSVAIEGSTVYTLADTEPLDQYGRSLLFVWTADGNPINLSLVQNGYAEAVFIGQNRLYEDEVEAAEDAAQAAGTGMWGAC
jgi:micrococcal nuclease